MMYQEFQAWSAEHALHWIKIGLDIEPDIRLFRSFKSGLVKGVKASSIDIYFPAGQSNPRDIYRALVADHQTGWVSGRKYQVPIIADERRVNSRFIKM